MDLSQKTDFCQQILCFFESFVSVKESLINNWFNVPTAQTAISVLFLTAEVLFDGAFSLWVSLTFDSRNVETE